MPPARIDAAIELSDRRRLAYAEYGDQSGVPVFLFHGLPGSRLAWGLLPDNPFPPGLRIVAPDRPGYGRSDPNPRRTLLDWANDVTQLADALAINTFTIIGVSGGGPGALACAWKLPERLASVGVVSCPAPTDAPGVFEGMSKTNRFFKQLAWRLPRLSAFNVRFLASMIRRRPARYIDAMEYKVHDVDKAILDRLEIKEMLAKDFTEALRSGSQGMVDDMNANHGCPWGFPLDEIKVQVHCWFCELDLSVPPAMGQYLRDTIPNCKTELVRNAGHLWGLENLHTVLHTLVRAQPNRM